MERYSDAWPLCPDVGAPEMDDLLAARSNPFTRQIPIPGPAWTSFNG
jgi:hypothetical protein